ncbi:MAG: hypothetical protein N3A00_01390 [Thermodesulfovibrio sp.]|nr:hypothetical protein [Thermodesulfovibrio sp.]
MKKVLVALLILTFVFGFVFSAYATTVSGTITKIDGNKVTVKQADGKEVTVELKVGDKITIKPAAEKGKEGAAPSPKKKKAVEGC